MIVKRSLQHNAIVAGGGAIEIELSRILKEYSRGVKDKTALIISAYAQAFETIPRQLAQNAGFDSTDILNELRAKHAKGRTLFYLLMYYSIDTNGSNRVGRGCTVHFSGSIIHWKKYPV